MKSILDIKKIVIIAIIILSFSLRFWDLDAVGLNSDEAVYSGQASTLAGDEEHAKFFSIYRAHPLLFQFTVSNFYLLGTSDEASRMVSAVFGAMTVVVVYYLGKNLVNRNVGIFASILLALMPYHLIITRQALVDVPMSFFFTLTIFLTLKYYRTNNAIWLFATGASAGLTFLSKETGIFASIVTLSFLYLSRKLNVKNIIVFFSALLLAASPYIILLAFHKEASGLGYLYMLWQISRPANHSPTFYLEILPGLLGFGTFALSLLGIAYALRKGKSQYTLLILWFFIPYVFYQLWPVKGFHYLVSLVPALCLFVAITLDSISLRKNEIFTYHSIRNNKILSYLSLRSGKVFALGLLGVLLLSNNIVLGGSQLPEETQDDSSILAGSGGWPYAREAALWIKDNTPAGSVIMTIGPSMANIIMFYGKREALALSVSPDPMKRNPAYTPITNPDLKIRSGEIQYIVYDSYSRSQFFTDKLMSYVDKYGAIPIYHSENDHSDSSPKIVVYEVFLGGMKRS